MKEIVNRLQENRQIERAKSILESNGYKVTKKSKRLKESTSDSILEKVSEYGFPVAEILMHPEEYGYYDDYVQGDDISPVDGVKKAIEEYMKTSIYDVLIVDGESEIPWEVFSELSDKFKEVPGGETFYQGMGTGEGVDYGTVDGVKVILWWIGGSNGAYLIPNT